MKQGCWTSTFTPIISGQGLPACRTTTQWCGHTSKEELQSQEQRIIESQQDSDQKKRITASQASSLVPTSMSVPKRQTRVVHHGETGAIKLQ